MRHEPRSLDIVTIRRATPVDAGRLARFAEQTFRDAFQAENTPEDMDAYCSTAFSDTVQSQLIADPAIDTLLAELGDDLAAYAQLRLASPPQIEDRAAVELWRFYVGRAHHGAGLAQRLMDAVLAAARGRGARTLWLGVWERNHRAQAFYRKAGFVRVGEQTFVLGGDLQTDAVMARRLD